MGLGGIIAGALNGGAQVVGEIANNAIINQGKKDLAGHESQLATERATALARLQQTIGREDMVYGTAGAGGQAKTQYELGRAKGLAGVETDAVVDRMARTTPLEAERTAAIEDAKGYRLNPGDQVVRKGQVVAENSRLTNAELYERWGSKKGDGAGGGGAAKVDHFDEKQVDAGRKDLMGQVSKAFIDEATQRPLPAAGNLAIAAFNQFIAAGAAPGEAHQRAYSATYTIAQEAQQLMRDPKYRGMKLDQNSAIDLAVKLRQDKMQAEQQKGK